ncbi:hypothetical protein GQR58_007612 [Nymphon striatum]|nr:hypothetical protein GQR58_007612 [Nymphon striatum]
MFKFIAIATILVGSAYSIAIPFFQTYPEYPGSGLTITGVTYSGCTELPCSVKQGTTFYVDTEFVSLGNYDLTKGTIFGQATLYGQRVRFLKAACAMTSIVSGDIDGNPCSLNQGGKYSINITDPVLTSLPAVRILKTDPSLDNYPVKDAWIWDVSGKRPRGRPRFRWRDVVTKDMDERGLCINDAYDKVLWRAGVNSILVLLLSGAALQYCACVSYIRPPLQLLRKDLVIKADEIFSFVEAFCVCNARFYETKVQKDKFSVFFTECRNKLVPYAKDVCVAVNHAVRRSARNWSGLWSDLVIEQALMRSSKSRGGLTSGRGMSETVRHRWILSQNYVDSIHQAMTQMSGVLLKTREQHTELGDDVEVASFRTCLLTKVFEYMKSEKLLEKYGGSGIDETTTYNPWRRY